MLYLGIQRRPTNFLDSIFLAEIFVFVIAIWLGYASNNWTDVITEQLLILRIKSDKVYRSIYVVFLFLVSACISLISISIPAIINLLDWRMFERFSITYFSQSFLLFLGSGFAGISLGALFHSRLMVKDGEKPLYAAGAGLLSITRYSIVNQYGIFNYILWIFPNVSAHHSILSDHSYFTFLNVTSLFLINLFYGVIYSIIKIVLLSKKKF